jgi:hypothetical protein
MIVFDVANVTPFMHSPSFSPAVMELAWLLRAKAPALDVSSPPYLLLDKLLIITRTNWTWWLFFLIRSVVLLLEGIRRRWSMGQNVSYPLQKANVFRPLETKTMQDPKIVVTCGCCLTQGRISSQTGEPPQDAVCRVVDYTPHRPMSLLGHPSKPLNERHYSAQHCSQSQDKPWKSKGGNEQSFVRFAQTCHTTHCS